MIDNITTGMMSQKRIGVSITRISANTPDRTMPTIGNTTNSKIAMAIPTTAIENKIKAAMATGLSTCVSFTLNSMFTYPLKRLPDYFG